MKIAIPYLDGNVYEHFGKAQQFKVYELDDEGNVTSSEVIDSNAEGHDAVAATLSKLAVDVVICGGMGDGAQSALAQFGILAFTGVEGEADKVIESFVKGDITSQGSNCGCGGNCGDGEGCGEGGCGGCGGGCGGCGGGPRILFEGENVGKACIVNYEGTFNDGKVFDSSFERGEPIQFVCGVGMMIKGFDMAVANMKIGETVNIHLMPEEAYGPVDPNAIIDIKISQLPGSEELNVGDKVFLSNAYGQQFPVTVLEKTEETIKLDANHEMAGKELNFKIELVDIIEA
ncbi:MAG: FKBP-type peptidyl-prolyl cis-trans isomerase [Saccharofermentans sp.]|nr:FKBP-type peptidyl-prolyl cis-trans isomerase [Saccharofermentans sp.]